MIRSDGSTDFFPRITLICLIAVLLPSLGAAQSNTENNQPTVSDQRTQSVLVDQDSQQPHQPAPISSSRTSGEPAVSDADASLGEESARPLKPNPLQIPPPPPTPVTSEPAKYDVRMIGHRNVGNGLNFYSLEREIAVGHDLAKQVEENTKLVTDPEITEYVNRIGQNLVRNSDSRVPFIIKVIDSNEVNAFALPGGFFYVDSGLILAAESESELAAVMAHEIAHVAARHATKNLTKQQIWNMASIPLMFVGGPAGYAIAEIASFAVPLSFLKFSRDAEREADMLGLQYDYAAGYDPQAFVQFFERLKAEEKQKHSKIAKMFSTHPMTADRISAAQFEIRTYFPDRDSYVVDTSEFAAVKAHLLASQGGTRFHSEKGITRPVLRNHTQDAADSEADAAPPAKEPDQKEDEQPTLKRSSSHPD